MSELNLSLKSCIELNILMKNEKLFKEFLRSTRIYLGLLRLIELEFDCTEAHSKLYFNKMLEKTSAELESCIHSRVVS